METNGLQQYKEHSISTMTQGELLLLLYDELVKHLTRAELALAKADYTLLEDSVDHSQRILRYLDETLDMQYPISQNLRKLYDYFDYELVRVKLGRNKTELIRVKKMVSELRESFRAADKNNDSGK